MKIAYVDTSCLLAVAFDEPGADEVAERLASCERLLSSNLLEAELRAALVREGVPAEGEGLLGQVAWIFPDRPLTRELRRATAHGYAKGADLWHLACALFLAPHPGDLHFATLDGRQRGLAKRLGFPLLLPSTYS